MYKFKSGDSVYVPNLSHKVLAVSKAPEPDNLFVRYYLPTGRSEEFYFDSYGKAKGELQPSVLLATQDNKERAEAFYNIVLEDVPENQSLHVFETLLEQFCREAIDAFDYGYEDQSRIDGVRNQLIQMFKDRL